MVKLLQERQLEPFAEHFSPSYNPTNYSRWVATSKPYGVDYQEVAIHRERWQLAVP